MGFMDQIKTLGKQAASLLNGGQPQAEAQRSPALIKEVHDAGYATDSKYASNIEWIMTTFGLKAIDPLARSLADMLKK